MKAKAVRAIIALSAVFFTIAAQSATYTWDGGGADDNWSDAANWNPDGAPVSANTTEIRLAGETRLAPVQDIGSPFVLNRLEYLKVNNDINDLAFTLSGNPLRFEADGTTSPCLYLTRKATCNLNNAVVIADDTTLIMNIDTWGIVFNGVISGGGGIDKLADAGAITLTQANSFSGGLTVRASDDQWRQVHINASGAMGTGEVHLYGGTMNTNTPNQGGLILNNTTTHTNTIQLFQNSPIRANGSTTLTGDIALNTSTLHLRGTGTATASGMISGDAAQALIKSDTGTWTLAGANSFTGRVSVQNGLLRFGAANALAPATPLTLTGGTADLNGHAQTVGQLQGEASVILTSATAATLTVDQTDNTAFAGRLTGALALTKSGTGSLTLNNSANTFTGDIAINGGTLVAAAPSSLGNAASIAANGGILELQTANTMPDTATLHIANGARVVIANGVAETVRALFVDGVQQPRGSYGTTASGATFTDNTLFGGDGILLVATGAPVTPTLFTWDAEGSGDTRLSTAANWDSDTAPAFDGTARAVFGTDGSTATVDASVSLYGITFNRDADFTLEANGGAITLREGGIAAAAPAATARTYTLAADTTLTAPQTWHIGNHGAAATTLAVSGIIGDDGLPADLTQSGNGTLILSGANTYIGTTTVQTGGVLRISHPLALGSADAPTVMERGSWLELSGGISVGEPITISGDSEVGHSGVIRNTGGSNVWSGPIICDNSRIRSTGGSLDILGGISVINQIALGANGGTQLRIAEKPIIAGNSSLYCHSGGGPVIFAVAGNVCGRIEACSRELRFDVPNAFAPTVNLDIGASHSPNAYVNLNGNDQAFATLKSNTTTPGERMIESASPATLTLTQNSNAMFDGIFAGAVSLVKNGTGTLTLTNALTSTSGGFTVTGGTLAIDGAGTLGPNATDIAITGSGTLSLANSATIADSAIVRMPESGDSGAKINLEAGVDETIGWLFFGDKMMRAGTHGSTASPARYQDDSHFTGTGVLRVRHDNSGTLFTIE